MSTGTPGYKKKLIEVALPLDEINKQSARENYIYRGNPSAVHKWWAQRPLAACRAVLFAQLVDDPSAHPDQFPSEEDQALERKRLFELIRRLVNWDNNNNTALYDEARGEIFKSCDGNIPPVLDPFAGGGSVPLEALRLGLDTYASDLNPVATIINRALVEIPQKWTAIAPVFPGAAGALRDGWPGATGLAEDVRQYGQWVREEAEKRIGHIYPKVRLDDGTDADALAWIWARTITCPNPACGARMPLAGTFLLSKKKGRERYAQPVIEGTELEFEIGGPKGVARGGTVSRKGAICLFCNTPVPLSAVRAEAKAGRMGVRLIAIVANGPLGRTYIAPTRLHEQVASVARSTDALDGELPEQALGFRVQAYGMTNWEDLFSSRQLLAISTFSDLVGEVRDKAFADALKAGLTAGQSLACGGSGARAYAETIGMYLAFAISKFADYNCSLAVWYPKEDRPKNLFARQAIPMVWDYPEINPFGEMGGTWSGCLKVVSDAIIGIPDRQHGASHVRQADAASVEVPTGAVICTDPPYYDNIAYADLSDFFYVWLRRTLGSTFSEWLGTMLTPKTEELIANPFRQGGQQGAIQFFEQGFGRVFSHLRKHASPEHPMAVFYAYKQSEKDDSGESSTGWETLLEGMIKSGWVVTATWPIRTERGGRIRDLNSNALASSVVLACRPRSTHAGSTDRRGFISELKVELPDALRDLQQGGIAPVDLAQAALGPGIAVFSRYGQVAEPDGRPMRVKAAQKLINQILAEVLAEQEGDFDSDTRFCIKWFEGHGFDIGRFGEAETLSKAMGTSVAGLERAGVLKARAGIVQLFSPAELPDDYDPVADERISVWEIVMHLAKRLDMQSINAAASLMASAMKRVDLGAAKELTYLLFSVCKDRKWADTALLFNELGTDWPEIEKASHTAAAVENVQTMLPDSEED